MKTKKLLFATLITLTIFSCDDMVLPEPVPSEIYYKHYGCYFNDYLTSVCVDNEKNVFISGYTVTENDSSYAYIVKSFSDGMRDWDIRSEVPFSKAHDIFYAEDTKLVYVVYATQDTKDSATIALTEYDFSGVFQKTRATKIKTTSVQSMSMLYRPNAPIRIFSQIDVINPQNNAKTDNYIVVFDADDTMLSEKITYPVEDRISGPISIVQSSETSSYLVVTASEASESKYTDIRLLYVEEMAVAWDEAFGEKGISESASDIIRVDNELAIAGNYKKDGESQKIIVYFSNLLGEEQRKITTTMDDFESDITTTSFCLNNYGNFVFTGSLFYGEKESDIFFLETSQAGENVKNNQFGTSGQMVGKNQGKIIKYLPLSDTYILGGDMEPLTNTDICIFSLDKEGDWIRRE